MTSNTSIKRDTALTHPEPLMSNVMPPENGRMEITVNLSAADWNAYVRFLAQSASKPEEPEWSVTVITTIVFFAVVLLYEILSVTFIGPLSYMPLFFACLFIPSIESKLNGWQKN